MRSLCLLVSSLTLLASEPSVTVYNGGFAVVRDRIDLALGQGAGLIRYAGASAHVEPGTALIAVPEGVRVLEHTYRNDPVSVTRLLQLFEGKTIDIEVVLGDRREIRKARIVRAPVTVHQEAWQRFGQAYAQRQQNLFWGAGSQGNEVLLEIDGQLRFGLPGTPIFPSLPAGTDLRPTLEWQVRAATPVQGQGEVSYLCDGMRWDAAYTLTAAADDEAHVDLNGLITVENQCGTDFSAARLKFVAGEVAKLGDGQGGRAERDGLMNAVGAAMDSRFANIESRAEGKAFSDFHLYTMPDPVDLRDRETKQLGFLDAAHVASSKRLIYDGLDVNWNQYQGWGPYQFRSQREFGTTFNPKVVVERVIENSAKNHLGKPLPAGVVRCYLKDADGKPEFIGESLIDHTPDGETLHLRTGNAFDLVGERVQTDFTIDENQHRVSETFRITLRNHRAQPAAVTVVEHLYRTVNWEIRSPSLPVTKRDSATIEVPLAVPAQGETTFTYVAAYSW
jgi:hypothetical protein